MKKLLFILALICILSCEKQEVTLSCVTADIHVYSQSGKITPLYKCKTLCTEVDFLEYPEGTRPQTKRCSDCYITIIYR